MPEKSVVEIPIVRALRVEVTTDPLSSAVIVFETVGDADIKLILPMTAMAELEAMLGQASAEQAKRQPKQ